MLHMLPDNLAAKQAHLSTEETGTVQMLWDGADASFACQTLLVKQAYLSSRRLRTAQVPHAPAR